VGHNLVLISLATLLLGLSACGDILGIAENPQLVASGPWRCLQSPVAAMAPQKDTAHVRVDACSFVSSNCSEAVTGLTASLCNKRDVNCTDPIRSGIMDVAGELSFDVPTGGNLGVGFDGYLQVTAPAALCTNNMVFGAAGPMLCGLLPSCNVMAPDANCMVPTSARALLFFNPAIQNDVTQPLPLPLVPTASIQPILQATGQTKLDPSKGFLFITALDCDGKPAAGVQFQLAQHQDGVTQLYVENGVISASATETDASGLAGFFNVPAGFVAVVGSVGSAGSGMPLGEIGVQVGAFTITYGTVVPAPN
jgi:hypothetical protein